MGARLDSAVTSEELREKFSFEPEFNKDGTPMVRAYAASLLYKRGISGIFK